MYKTITEGKAKIKIPVEKKISKKLPVFYNPVMKFNRDISILLLKSINKKNMQIGLPLAGTGIRGIRFLLELKKSQIKTIAFNDYSKNSIKIIKNNLKLNKTKNKTKVTQKEASIFMFQSKGFDYIDLDPFGTPNPFLDTACRRIARKGILAVTATDTSALAGSFPKACLRKYWAVPLRNEIKHEIGLRILIRKCQLIAAQYEKALTPIYSYSKDHYMRIFFTCEKSKSKSEEIIKQHSHFANSGPMWLGKFCSQKLAEKIAKKNKIKENQKFLDIIRQESKINTVGFYDIHAFCKKNKLKIPKKELLKKKIKQKTTDTHFSPTGIRSSIKEKELIKIIQQLS